jgi:hypothetical protein
MDSNAPAIMEPEILAQDWKTVGEEQFDRSLINNQSDLKLLVTNNQQINHPKILAVINPVI